MGELTKEQAKEIRDGYVSKYEKIKEKVGKNMGDMDFENAVQKDEMEEKTESMKQACDDYIQSLQELTFS